LIELLVLVAKLSLDPTAGARYIACRVGEAVLAKVLQRMVGSPEDTFGLFGLFASVGMRTALKAVDDDVGRAWTVGELAEIAGMSRSQFKAEFAATVGTNVRDFIDLRRLRFAESRLAAGLAGVSEVATSVGFRSKSSFQTAVKKLGGLRPGPQLRDLLRER
jgi:AraC-like DNA-binding protein